MGLCKKHSLNLTHYKGVSQMSDLKELSDRVIYAESAYRSACAAAELARENTELNNTILRLSHELAAKKELIARLQRKNDALIEVPHA
jgi:hypothetical protein